YTVRTLPPFLGGGLRFLAAGLVMLVVTLVLRGPGVFRVGRVELGTAALVGTLMLAGGSGLLMLGEQRVPSGLAALLVACVPLWIVVLRAGLGDRPPRVTGLGVLLGLAGGAILLLPGGGSDAASLGFALLIVLASLSWSAGSLLSVRRPLPRDPLVLATIEMLAGGAVLLAGSGVRGEWSGFSAAQVSGQSWAAVGYLVGFGSLLAFTAYVYLLGSAPGSLVSPYASANPAIAVLLGALIAGERLGLTAVAGAVVIVLAVALVVTEESRATRRAAQRHVPAGPALLDTGSG